MKIYVEADVASPKVVGEIEDLLVDSQYRLETVDGSTSDHIGQIAARAKLPNHIVYALIRAGWSFHEDEPTRTRTFWHP